MYFRYSFLQCKPKNENIKNEIEELKKEFNNFLGNINQKFEAKVDKIQSGDELPPGVLKMIKIFPN